MGRSATGNKETNSENSKFMKRVLVELWLNTYIYRTYKENVLGYEAM